MYRGNKNRRNNGRNNHRGENRGDNRQGGSNDNSYKGINYRNTNNQQSVLPSPAVLQEYEYATEGAANRIIEMAEIEQERRNAWEDEYLRFYKKSLRIGQICGFLLLVTVVLAVVSLANNGYENVAEILAVSGFIAVALASIFSNRSHNKYPRKPNKQFAEVDNKQ